MTLRHPAILAAALVAVGTPALAQTEIRVHYAIPTIWADTQDALTRAFMEAHPDITVTLDGPAEGYDEGVQRLLRESIAGTAPDVAYVGLNRWRVLEDRGLLQPLDPFLPADSGGGGLHPRPAVARPVREHAMGARHVRLHAGHVRQSANWSRPAGGSMEDFPTTFDGVIASSARRSTRWTTGPRGSGSTATTGGSSRSSAPMAAGR